MQDSESRYDWTALKTRIDVLSRTESDQLSEQSANDILAERAARFRREENHTLEDAEEMIVFEEAGTRYAVPLRMLAEIRPVTRMTALPLVSQHILGLINFRGRIVAIYSLSNSMHENNATASNQQRGSALIGHGVAAHMALFAENVIGTVRVKSSDVCATPISLGERDYIAGIGSDGLVFLDLEKLVKNTQFYLA